MKGIDERKNSDGSISYRARVRVKGHAPIPNTFSSLTLAKKWKKTTEVEIEKGEKIMALSRYEMILEKSLYKAYNELLRLQGICQGLAVLPSISVDVNRLMLIYLKKMGSFRKFDEQPPKFPL